MLQDNFPEGGSASYSLHVTIQIIGPKANLIEWPDPPYRTQLLWLKKNPWLYSFNLHTENRVSATLVRRNPSCMSCRCPRTGDDESLQARTAPRGPRLPTPGPAAQLDNVPTRTPPRTAPITLS